MLLGNLRGDIPLVILRPTIITSIYKEPLPGWIEGTRYVILYELETLSYILAWRYIYLQKKNVVSTISCYLIHLFRFCRTIDSLIIGYAKGKLPCLFGDPELIMDVVSFVGGLCTYRLHACITYETKSKCICIQIWVLIIFTLWTMNFYLWCRFLETWW